MPRDPKVVSYTMSHIRGKDTGLELALRKALSARGVHYRLYSNKIYGHPDLAIEKLKIAIFADSEFWHGYHFEENEAKIKTHRDYWIPKIERNIARDKEVNEELAREGYLVLRFWGQEIEKHLDEVVNEILKAIDSREKIFALQSQIKELTTLAYLERGDEILLLHRDKEKNDVNEGKWIGVGGHLEAGETPLRCVKREVLEETGYQVQKPEYLGKIDFLNDQFPPERMYLYKITEFVGNLKQCDEGDLAWVKKDEMGNLPMWEGDKAFLPLLDSPHEKPFSLILVYEGGKLAQVIGPSYPPKKKKSKKSKK